MEKRKKRSKEFTKRLSLVWRYFILIYGVIVFLIGSMLIILNSSMRSSQTNIYSDEIKEEGFMNFFSGGDPMISLLVVISFLLIIIGLLFVYANKRVERLVEKRIGGVRSRAHGRIR